MNVFTKWFKKFVYPLLSSRQRFTRIYNGGGWGNTESVSGKGSTLAVTEPLRRELPSALERLEITSLLDAPCGDFNWMSEVLKDAPAEMEYIGADIVIPLIDDLQKKHEASNIRFIVADIVRDTLPPVDLILCRDCFIHLSKTDIEKSLSNFKKTGARYLATNSFPNVQQYTEIETGKWRQLNLELPPFCFPPPQITIEERGRNGKFLGIWKFKDLSV